MLSPVALSPPHNASPPAPALPDPPQLFSPPHLEADTAAASSCRVLGAFPVEETRVVLALDGDPLETEVTATAEAVMAVAQINARTVGHRELSCTAAVGAAEQTARALIHVYRMDRTESCGSQPHRSKSRDPNPEIPPQHATRNGSDGWT